jgi:hypothetical protein
VPYPSGSPIYRDAFDQPDTTLVSANNQPPWSTFNSTGTVNDILSGRYRCKTTGTALAAFHDYGRAQVMANVMDFVLVFDYSPLTSLHSYVDVCWRGDGVTSTLQGNVMANCLLVEVNCNTGAIITPYKTVASGAFTTLASSASLVTVANSTYRFVLLNQGSRIRIKSWDITTDEPQNWTFDLNDPTFYQQVGAEYISIGGLGNNTVGSDVVFDNFNLYRLETPQLIVWTSPSGATAYSDSLSDTLVFTDTENETRALHESLTDALVFTDVEKDSGGLDWNSSLADWNSSTVDWNAGGGATAYTASFLDSLAFTDGQTTKQGMVSAQADTLAFTDVQNTTQTMVSASAETLTFTDVQNTTQTMTSAQTDALAFTDVQNTVQTMTTALADALVMADAAAGVVAGAVALSDALVMADATSAAWHGSETVTEALTFTDTSASTQAMVGAMADALTFTDSQNTLAHFVWAFTDGVVFTDSVNTTNAEHESFTDALVFADSVGDRAAYVTALLDILIFTDVAQFGFSGSHSYSDALLDALSFTDSSNQVASFHDVLSDTLIFADLVGTALALHELTSDSLIFTDSASAKLAMVASLADMLTLTTQELDQASWHISLADVLLLTNYVNDNQQAAVSHLGVIRIGAATGGMLVGAGGQFGVHTGKATSS